MSDFKEAFNQYKASLALAMVKGGESSRLPKIFDDIDRHEYLAQSMFETGQQSMQAKIDALKNIKSKLEIDVHIREKMINEALHYAENRKLGNGISGDNSSDLDYIIRVLHGDFEHE